MSSFVKYLVIVTFSAFFAIAIWGVFSLDWVLVRGGGIVALLISPLLLEVFSLGAMYCVGRLRVKVEGLFGH